MTAKNFEIFIAFQHLSDLYGIYCDLTERCYTNVLAAVQTLQHGAEIAGHFRPFKHLWAPSPRQSTGSIFKSPRLPSVTEMREAHLSENSLPHLPALVELAKQITPRAHGAKCILEQMRKLDVTKKEYDEAKWALAMVEVLEDCGCWEPDLAEVAGL